MSRSSFRNRALGVLLSTTLLLVSSAVVVAAAEPVDGNGSDAVYEVVAQSDTPEGNVVETDNSEAVQTDAEDVEDVIPEEDAIDTSGDAPESEDAVEETPEDPVTGDTEGAGPNDEAEEPGPADTEVDGPEAELPEVEQPEVPGAGQQPEDSGVAEEPPVTQVQIETLDALVASFDTTSCSEPRDYVQMVWGWIKANQIVVRPSNEVPQQFDMDQIQHDILVGKDVKAAEYSYFVSKILDKYEVPVRLVHSQDADIWWVQVRIEEEWLDLDPASAWGENPVCLAADASAISASYAEPVIYGEESVSIDPSEFEGATDITDAVEITVIEGETDGENAEPIDAESEEVVLAAGNNIATATSISLGTEVKGTLNSTNTVDYYRVNLATAGRLTVRVKAPTNGIEKLDCYCYDPSGSSIDNGARFTRSSVTGVIDGSHYWDLAPGTYYICFKRYSSSYSGSYSFTTKHLSAGSSFSGSASTISSAYAADLGRTYKGHIAENDKTDHYKLVLSSSGRFTIQIQASENTSGGVSNLSVILYNPSGSQIGSYYPSRSSVTGVMNYSRYFDLTAGTYYLKISSYNSNYGSYSVSCSFASAGESFTESQGGSNNTMTSASAISLDKTYTGQLAVNDSSDQYKVVMSSSGTLYIQIKTPTSDKQGVDRISITLYDSSGKTLLSQYPSQSSTTGQIEALYSCNVSAGTYYIKISPYWTSSSGVYTLMTSRTKPKPSVASATVTLSGSSYTYTGAAIKPSVTVKLDGKTLVNGTDYTVSYSSNIAVGTAKVTITGKGSYGGTVSKTFTITKRSISSCSVSLAKTSYVYNGSGIQPGVTVKYGSTTLKKGTDYTVSYSSNVKPGTAKVTITGKGSLNGTVTKTFTITRFSDTPNYAWYVSGGYLDYVVLNGLMTGYGTTLFGPDDTLTRAQVATILFRYANPGSTATTNSASYGKVTHFSDVSKGQYYTAAVEWCYQKGIITGYGGTGRFGPNDYVTREQLATMIYRFAGYYGKNGGSTSVTAFPDRGSISSYATKAMGWCLRKGILTGDGATGKAMPQAYATRSQMAKMMTVLCRDVL